MERAALHIPVLFDDFRDDARDRDGFVGVVLGAKRMMREQRDRQQRRGKNCSPHRGYEFAHGHLGAPDYRILPTGSAANSCDSCAIP